MATTANSYLQVTELDFDDIRNNLKSYLSTQKQFQDYDFEGSAMSTMLDVLAYNTHYNSFYINMLANEMFLDTAQQRDSVVSFGKALGYTPISAIGATATVDLTFTGVANTVSQFTIPKNSQFTTTIDDVTYTYVTPRAYTVFNDGNGFAQTVEIKEGLPLTHRYVVNSNNSQRYVIPNSGVDATSIVVKVQNSSVDTTVSEYTLATNVTQVFSTSEVYFLEEAYDGKYEIVFGSGSLGKTPVNGNIIIIEYLVCNGEVTNGASAFTVDQLNLQPSNVSYSNVALAVRNTAQGGRSQESIESIKFNAPRNFQTQNRAVIDNDYSRILLSENPDLQSVIAYGGEQAVPPVYGKVYIAVKPFSEQFATQNRKSQLKASLLSRTPLAVDPVLIDPDYTYIIADITTNYDGRRTTENSGSIIQAVRDAITNFSENNLERFGNKLRYSKFVRALDNVGVGSILNNNATIKIQKRLVPNTQRAEKLEIDYNNALRKNSIESTQFTYNGFPCFLDDDGNGVITIYRFNQNKEKVFVVPNAGTVDYDAGTVVVNNFLPTDYAGIEMRITAAPESYDVLPVREQILIMNSNDASVTAIGEGVGAVTTSAGS